MPRDKRRYHRSRVDLRHSELVRSRMLANLLMTDAAGGCDHFRLLLKWLRLLLRAILGMFLVHLIQEDNVRNLSLFRD
jgi:hypothetical protein